MPDDRFWVGLDLGAHVTHICVIDETGNTLKEQPCQTDLAEIETALAEFPRPAIGLLAVEAGSDTHVVRKMLERGYPVGIFETRKASRFLSIRRNKTDVSDARGLADLARLGRHTVSRVFLKSLDCQRLRSQLRLRQKLVRLRVSVDGQVRSQLRLYGRVIAARSSRDRFGRLARAELDRLHESEGIDLRSDVIPLIEISEALRTHVRRLDTELAAVAEANPVCGLLMEVPGVGPIASLSFYSAIEDAGRFRRAQDVGAYFGLTPRRYQSGAVSRTLGITKTGSSLTRQHLVGAAMTLRRALPECSLSEWANLLRDRIGPRRARVALARKLAIVLLTMWKTGAHFQPYPPNHQKEVACS